MQGNFHKCINYPSSVNSDYNNEESEEMFIQRTISMETEEDYLDGTSNLDIYDPFRMLLDFLEEKESVALDQSTCSTKSQRRSSKPFIVITERKLKPDAIHKKIQKSFYKWLINYLNEQLPNDLKFIKLSKNIIKTIKKKKVVEIMNKSLNVILFEDEGSSKYKDQFVNKRVIQRINQSTEAQYDEMKELLELPLKSYYQKFLENNTTIDGPSPYVEVYEKLKREYLELIIS